MYRLPSDIDTAANEESLRIPCLGGGSGELDGPDGPEGPEGPEGL